MELCLVAKQKTGLHLYMQWWEHTDMYIMGIRSGHAAEDGGGERDWVGIIVWKGRGIVG